MSRKTGTGKCEKLVARCQALQPIPTAVAYPCEETALAGAIEAGVAGLIEPILVGPAATIRDVAKKAGIVLGARVPIILTSRADSVRARMASCAVGMLAAHARRANRAST
jgi:phosphotransacetylase